MSGQSEITGEKQTLSRPEEEIKSKTKSTIKTKFDEPKLDPEWLYQTLRQEINKGARYDLENDAKLRAITQGTVNYEQFRYPSVYYTLSPQTQ